MNSQNINWLIKCCITLDVSTWIKLIIYHHEYCAHQYYLLRRRAATEILVHQIQSTITFFFTQFEILFIKRSGKHGFFKYWEHGLSSSVLLLYAYYYYYYNATLIIVQLFHYHHIYTLTYCEIRSRYVKKKWQQQDFQYL